MNARNSCLSWDTTLLPQRIFLSIASICKRRMGEIQRQPDKVLHFTREQEQSSPSEYTDTLGQISVRTNASILKAGAFRNVACIYKVKEAAS